MFGGNLVHRYVTYVLRTSIVQVVWPTSLLRHWLRTGTTRTHQPYPRTGTGSNYSSDGKTKIFLPACNRHSCSMFECICRSAIVLKFQIPRYCLANLTSGVSLATRSIDLFSFPHRPKPITTMTLPLFVDNQTVRIAELSLQRKHKQDQ